MGCLLPEWLSLDSQKLKERSEDEALPHLDQTPYLLILRQWLGRSSQLSSLDELLRLKPIPSAFGSSPAWFARLKNVTVLTIQVHTFKVALNSQYDQMYRRNPEKKDSER